MENIVNWLRKRGYIIGIVCLAFVLGVTVATASLGDAYKLMVYKPFLDSFAKCKNYPQVICRENYSDNGSFNYTWNLTRW